MKSFVSEKSRFEKAIRLMRRAGYEDIAERLTMEMETMASEVYKIAVVGEFKSGKSTLINKVFLREDVLFTDIMEATAVPTEIRYSRDKYLEVVPYDTLTSRRPNPFENGVFEDIEEIRGEGEPFRILGPSAEEIAKYTSAENSKERARLAGRISRVKLGWPSVDLAGLAVFDTPGVNSVNEAVIATTYRIIPESDLVLFLTNSRQLSGAELEFLSGRVLSEGIARIMMIVTYDPHVGILSARQRKSLVDAIRGQLASIGQGEIPVEMVDIRDRVDKPERTEALGIRIKKETGEETKDVRKAVDSVIGDLLGERTRPPVSIPEVGDEDSDEEIGVAALKEKLARFIRENVRPARIEKADSVLRNQVRLARVRFETETAALRKSKTDRERMLEDFREKEKRIRREYEELSMRLHDDLQQIRTRMSSELDRGLDRIAKSYIDGFDRCDSMGDLQDRLNRSSSLLQKDVEAMFVEVSEQTRERIEALSENYGMKSLRLLNSLRDENGGELYIDGGVLANVPPVAIIALDFSLFALFGPFRPLARVVVRFLANEIPFLNKILPASVAASLLKSKIKGSLAQQFGRIKTEMKTREEKAFDQIDSHFRKQWQDQIDEQLNSVRSGLQKTIMLPDDRQRYELLSEIKEEMEQVGLS